VTLLLLLLGAPAPPPITDAGVCEPGIYCPLCLWHKWVDCCYCAGNGASMDAVLGV
jgi:hypothetical protein